MAKNDMRIDVDFVDHPKTKRLIRMTGYEGFLPDEIVQYSCKDL